MPEKEESTGTHTRLSGEPGVAVTPEARPYTAPTVTLGSRLTPPTLRKGSVADGGVRTGTFPHRVKGRSPSGSHSHTQGSYRDFHRKDLVYQTERRPPPTIIVRGRGRGPPCNGKVVPRRLPTRPGPCPDITRETSTEKKTRAHSSSTPFLVLTEFHQTDPSPRPRPPVGPGKEPFLHPPHEKKRKDVEEHGYEDPLRARHDFTRLPFY